MLFLRFVVSNHNSRKPFWLNSANIVAATFIMSGSADIAQEVIGRLGQTSKSLTDPERKLELALGCEAAKETLLRSARDLVAQAGGKPMLASKSCDGTPIMTMHRVAHQQPHGKNIRTAGRQCSEFLVANQFLRTRASFGGGWDTKVIIAEATPLSHGKQSLAFCPPVGSTGIHSANWGIGDAQSSIIVSIVRASPRWTARRVAGISNKTPACVPRMFPTIWPI